MWGRKKEIKGRGEYGGCGENKENVYCESEKEEETYERWGGVWYVLKEKMAGEERK